MWTIWNVTQVRYLPKYESLRKAPIKEKKSRVPIHLLNVFAASALLCLSTDFAKRTIFTSTPENASVISPWLAVVVNNKNNQFIKKWIWNHYLWKPNNSTIVACFNFWALSVVHQPLFHGCKCHVTRYQITIVLTTNRSTENERNNQIH